MKRIIYTLICLTFSFFSQAQIPGAPKNLLSPNSASLGLYGEIPISLFTGTPSVSIPIYEMKYGDVTVPITLSYHASGIRPDQHPSWVGLGWTLQAGGVISRVINDKPDEYDNGFKYEQSTSIGAPVSLATAGYYYKHSDFNLSQASNDLFIIDSEPDQFSFNFLGYSGNFYLNNDGSWKVECDKPVKITFDNTFLSFPSNLIKYDTNMAHNSFDCGNTKSFSGFTITDEYGVRYVFGGTSSAIEYSIDFFKQNTDEWFANSWMLTKIILPNDEVINFEYQRDAFINQLYYSVNQIIQTGTRTSGGFLSLNTTCNNTASYPLGYHLGGMLISPTYLTKIISPVNKIILSHSVSRELGYDESFYTTKRTYWENDTEAWSNSDSYPMYLPFLEGWDNNLKSLDPETRGAETFPECLNNMKWQKLDQIAILDINGALIKSFKFNYSNSSYRRLTLYNLEELSNYLSVTGKKYSFEYYNMELLPPYLSNKVDHWGYSNNTYASIYPNVSFETYYSLRDATTNNAIASAGSLKSITYPTGGTTEFVYEPNMYSKQLKVIRWEGLDNVENKNAGGIRIRKITNYPEGVNVSTNKIQKEYFYVTNYTNDLNLLTAKSSGVLGGQAKYYFEDYNVKTRNTNQIYNKQIFSSQSVLQACTNTTGSHIGYSEVIEKQTNGSYTKSFFTNFDTFGDETARKCLDEKFDETCFDNSLMTPYLPYNSRSQERGKLTLSEIHNSSDQIKYSKRIFYNRINELNNYVKSFRVTTGRICDSTGDTYDDATKYKHYTYSYLPVKEIETNYDNLGGTPLIKSTDYKYDPIGLLEEQTVDDSNHNTFITRYKYIGNVEATGTKNNELFDPLIAMNARHMIAYPIEITNIKKDNTEHVIGSNLFLYKPISTSPIYYKLWSESSLAIEKSIPLNEFKSINISGSSSSLDQDPKYMEKVRYNKYDVHGNPLFVTKNDSENSVYLWSYYFQYPIAEVKNATWNDVIGIIPENNILALGQKHEPESSDWTTISGLNNLNNSLVTIYSYNYRANGLSSITAPNGIKTFYDYDPLGRLSRVYIIENNVIKVLKSLQYKYYNN
jgi:hypothetical protein